VLWSTRVPLGFPVACSPGRDLERLGIPAGRPSLVVASSCGGRVRLATGLAQFSAGHEVLRTLHSDVILRNGSFLVPFGSPALGPMGYWCSSTLRVHARYSNKSDAVHGDRVFCARS
jgi:hypothetical protein